MSPIAFLKRPVRQLSMISDYRGTHTAAPNFAYNLMARRVTPEQLAELDLSTLKVALNGAEPVRRATMEQIKDLLAPAGFAPSAMRPAYGMAEVTLMATVSRGIQRYLDADADALEQNRYTPATGRAVSLASSGEPGPGIDVRIVDPETLHVLPDDHVGEIWLRSASVASGYHNRPAQTVEEFRAHTSDGEGPYLRTGDLGLLHEGELYVTGRRKDLLIINGRNLYPQDIEEFVLDVHPALAESLGVAISVDINDAECLVLIQAVKHRLLGDVSYDQLAATVKTAVARHFEVPAPGVVFVNHGGIHLTTSGKVQRASMRAAFLKDELTDVASPGAQMNDIAVVGLDCRFPKADDPAALWKLLLDGADGIDEIPAERWDAAELHDDGTVNHRAGGLISDADAFDNDFFGITPREAEAMDPQQRVLLQTAWRALENATLDPRGQAGSNTGVFVGVMANEWAHLHMSDFREITAQTGSGNGYFMTANRLSYQLDFKGPSLAVDTACSSSLVAAHLAVQALRNGECDQAIAAGVNLTLTPALNVFYTKAGLAAPDGRCKPFSGKADGIGRGEGVAVVVLRRLEDAVAAGLPIYAVIKGSAVNSDGRSNGITAPNRWAQQQVVASACLAADIVPEQINFIEAHGTGTLLGDMIEAKALAHAHRSRRETPCAIGSIKGNLGHTEGAAGMAGLIKVVLSLHHRVVPPSRFAETENEQLRLADGGLRMLSEPMELPAETVHAGVSSFGIGGTNSTWCSPVPRRPNLAPTATGRSMGVCSPYRQTLQKVCTATLYS